MAAPVIGAANPVMGAAAAMIGSQFLDQGNTPGYRPASVDYTGAKHGIRWRVADAKAAGIHPIYALGAPGVGSGILQPGYNKGGQDPMLQQGMEQMGQAVSNYINRPSRLEIERAKAIKESNEVLDLRMKHTQADIMETERRFAEFNYTNSVIDRQRQQAGHKDLKEIPWDLTPVRSFKDGTVRMIPNREVYELPDSATAPHFANPYRFSKDDWHPDLVRQYRW